MPTITKQSNLANLGFWYRNLAEDTVQYHDQWAKMLGYSLDEIQNDTRNWQSLLHLPVQSLASGISVPD